MTPADAPLRDPRAPGEPNPWWCDNGHYNASERGLCRYCDAPLRTVTVTVGPGADTVASDVDNSDGYCACGQSFRAHDWYYCDE